MSRAELDESFKQYRDDLIAERKSGWHAVVTRSELIGTFALYDDAYAAGLKVAKHADFAVYEVPRGGEALDRALRMDRDSSSFDR